jgi:hypothetical protein
MNLDGSDSITENDLVFVNYVSNGTFHSCLMKHFDNAKIHAIITTRQTFKPLVIFMNGLNVTRHMRHLITSFESDNDLTVKDIANYIISLMTRKELVCVALRDALLELEFVDTDLDQTTFMGSKELVKLLPSSVVDANDVNSLD